VLLILFVVGHLVGNLQVFGPPELINNYAHFLQSKPVLVWSARLGLLVIVGLHIATAVQLSVANKEARPVGYADGKIYGASWASRYMLVSGLVIAAFIVYHIAHFTALIPGISGATDFRKLRTVMHGESVPDVYAMMILGFQVWWVCLFYILAQGLLFVHLRHGISSMCQSFGLRNHVWWPRIDGFAKIASIAIFVGYALIPAAIYLRVVGADYADKVRAEIKAKGLDEPQPAPAAGKETN
jgi:succinate dehydrogenase / fumarate reductase cytochrome b subunit